MNKSKSTSGGAPSGATAVEFRFPMPPHIGNARGHWRARHGKKQQFYSTCDLMQKLKLLPAPPRRPWGQVTASSVMHLGAMMDDDNALARHKYVLDWLKTRGYLADDRRTNIEWARLPEQIIGRKQKYEIVLTLTPRGT